MNTLQQIRDSAPGMMAKLVDPSTCLVRFTRMQALHDQLGTLGFSLSSQRPYGPGPGRQLFYKNGMVTVRVKTTGEEKGPRTGQPHLSVSVSDGRGDAWFHDVAKLNALGRLSAKSFSPAERFKPLDHDGKPQRFVMIQGGKSRQYGNVFDAWADRTHFPFADGFVDDLKA